MYAAKVRADSAAFGARLTTIEVTFPRFILAEMNTHKMLSKNSASSRAIPVERRVEQVRDNPFVPEAFGVNKRGMQATETLDERDGSKARDVWLRARDAAVAQADVLCDLGVHKQHANRVIETYAWHTAILSGTDWDNFFALRCHPAAQPEMQITAGLMRDAMAASTPRELRAGAWHLPYVDNETDIDMIYDWSHAVGDVTPERLGLAMSVARCAAVSFERQDVKKEIRQYAERHDMLATSRHWSPFEHQAQVVEPNAHLLSDQFFYQPPFAPVYEAGPNNTWVVAGYYCGNFRAPFLQYRKTLRGERVATA